MMARNTYTVLHYMYVQVRTYVCECIRVGMYVCVLILLYVCVLFSRTVSWNAIERN